MSLLSLDNSITNFLYIAPHLSSFWQDILYGVASVFVYLIPIILLVLFFIRSKNDKVNSVRLFIGSVFTWQILNRVISDITFNDYGFRMRPFADHGIKEFFLEQPGKAFPSDHASFIAAFTFLLYFMGYKKLGNIVLIGGIISTIARVGMGFHYFGDVLAGWVVGAFGFYLYLIVDPYIKKILNKIFKTQVR